MLKILYICTHNRCRSILSEAISNQLSKGAVIARSAGSAPSGEVHPLSLKYLVQSGYATQGLQSQSWDDFEDFHADVVVTVCDTAAAEVCPVWFGDSIKIHWGLSDPSKVKGSDTEIERAFTACIQEIEKRVYALNEIVTTSPSRLELKEKLVLVGAVSSD